MMLAQAARALGARTVALDPAPDAPAAAAADGFVAGAYDDLAALEELCRQSDAVTYEFENVPAETLRLLEGKYNIKQGIAPLLDSQDRLREKTRAREAGLAVPRFECASTVAELRRAVRETGFPCVFKTRRLGYDGHGQAAMRSEADLPKAEALMPVEGIVEEFVDFDAEASIVMVGDAENLVTFPIGRNVHREGILDLTSVPARLGGELERRMEEQSRRFMLQSGYRGILAIEYFVRGDEILFNEMAPRPHNSGHYTIEGCDASQFDALARWLLGMPPTQPRLLGPTVMKNILGRDLEAARALEAEGREGVHVHLYGKSESRPKRKMGHITFTDTTPEDYASRWAGRFL